MRPAAWLIGVGLVCLGACGDASPSADALEQGELVCPQSVADYEAWASHGTLGIPYVHGLQLAVETIDAEGAHLVGSSGRPLTCEAEPDGDACVTTTVRCVQTLPVGIEVSVRLTLGGIRGTRLETSFRNVSDGPITVRRVFPFLADASTGGVLAVPDDPPDRVRVLQNGTDEVVDYFVNVLPATTPLTDWTKNALILGGASSYSCGSALAYGLDTGTHALIGFLGPEWAVPLVAIASSDGSKLDHVSGELRFPKPTELPPGAELSGGTALFYLGPGPFESLEAYATELARFHDIHLPEAPQSGWDSWYTPRGTDLDPAYIADNAAALDRLFGAWGLSSQQIDWGWQDNWGDWRANAKFPDGMAAAAASIAAHGLKPELWIAPFSAHSESSVWKEHPDWFAAKNVYGKVLAGEDQHPFDLARPDVLAHLKDLGRRVADWGFQSVKMDFGYYALLVDRPADWQTTPTKLYRDAVRAFREGVGPDPTFINIAMVVQNYGLVDALRVGLDTWPCWEGGTACEHDAGGLGAQGVKPMVRMTARRYWLNGRVWWNHNDQVFVRDLTLDEQRAWFTLAAISGGMISLGEDATTLTDDQADVYRKILPLSGLTGRPLDLFEREFPEVWVQRQEDPPGAVVAFFNWGSNTDLTTLPYSPRPEGPVTHAVDLSLDDLCPGSCLAYEFWAGKTTQVEGRLEADVPPHAVRVFRVVPLTPGQFVGTDRHVLMGPGVVSNVEVHHGPMADVSFDGDWLEARLRTVPGVRERVGFVAAGSEGILGCGADGDVSIADVAWDDWSRVCQVTIEGGDAAWHTLRVYSMRTRP